MVRRTKRTRQFGSAYQVTLPVSSVYRIKELMTWVMLENRVSAVSARPKGALYFANPVFLLPRKIIMIVVMMNSTEAESVTPTVKTH